MTTVACELSDRELAILRAVDMGRAQLLAGCEPDLAVDGRWCDHSAARTLIANGLIRQIGPAAVGSLVAAKVTEAGIALLEPDLPQAG